jgi:hypothetical protein
MLRREFMACISGLLGGLFIFGNRIGGVSTANVSEAGAAVSTTQPQSTIDLNQKKKDLETAIARATQDSYSRDPLLGDALKRLDETVEQDLLNGDRQQEVSHWINREVAAGHDAQSEFSHQAERWDDAAVAKLVDNPIDSQCLLDFMRSDATFRSQIAKTVQGYAPDTANHDMSTAEAIFNELKAHAVTIRYKCSACFESWSATLQLPEKASVEAKFMMEIATRKLVLSRYIKTHTSEKLLKLRRDLASVELQIRESKSSTQP